jgi:hypothetical protein
MRQTGWGPFNLDRLLGERCCVAHDRLYHAGGPADADAEKSFEARRDAGEQLRRCVIEVGRERVVELETCLWSQS